MSCLSPSHLRCALLLSASSLVLLTAASAPALAQQSGTTSPPPPATPTPQPSASPTAEPSPAPQSGATPAPAQQQPATPTPEQQKGGGTVLPTTRVVQPAQKPKPSQPQQQVVTNQPPAPTQEQVQAEANRQVVQQTQNFNERRDNVILPKIGASTYELSQRDHREPPARKRHTVPRPRIAISGRLPGLDEPGRFPRPQRARQRSISDQRNSAA